MWRLSALALLGASVSGCAPQPNDYAFVYDSSHATGTVKPIAFRTPPIVVQDQRKASKIAQQGQESIANLLRDPKSAQFRDATVFKIGDEDYLVCVDLNGKNAYGGYNGYSMAVARVVRGAPARAYIATEDTKYGADMGAAAAVLTVCQRPSPSLSGSALRMGETSVHDIMSALKL